MTRDTLERLADEMAKVSVTLDTFALGRLRAGAAEDAILNAGIAEGYRKCAARLRAAAKEAKE